GAPARGARHVLPPAPRPLGRDDAAAHRAAHAHAGVRRPRPRAPRRRHAPRSPAAPVPRLLRLPGGPHARALRRLAGPPEGGSMIRALLPALLLATPALAADVPDAEVERLLQKTDDL